MKNFELFAFIRDFSVEDRKNFKSYLKSPYFQKAYSLDKVFNEIILNKDLFKDFNYDKMFSKLCEGLLYSKSTLDKQLSYLSKEIIKYLKLKSFESDIAGSEINLNEYLLKTKNLPVLKNNIKKTKNLLNNIPDINDRTFLQSFQLNVIDFTSLIYSSGFKFKKHSEESLNYLENAYLDLLLYAYMQAAGIYVNYIFMNMNTKMRYNTLEDSGKLFSEFNQLDIFEHNSKRKKIFEIYRNMYLTFYDKNNKENYIKYKLILEQNLNLLNTELINMHYQVLINYCMMKDRLGEEKDFYKKESIGLLFKYFKNNYFNVDNNEYIGEVEFSNFIVRAYSIKEYEMIKLFVENNSSKLKTSESADMINYGLAYYYLGKKVYRKVLKHINSIDKKNPTIKFDITNIEIRVYYELNKIDMLNETIHNYRKIILNDNDLIKADKESLFKLLKYLNYLINIKYKTNEPNMKYDAGYYKNLIEKEPIFSLKNWLIEKFDEIIAARKLIKKIKI